MLNEKTVLLNIFFFSILILPDRPPLIREWHANAHNRSSLRKAPVVGADRMKERSTLTPGW